jgi:thioredoxin-dependent peroxiredoxin
MSGLKKPRASPRYKEMLGAGAAAPDFDLWGSDGKKHSLKEFAGKKLVIYFYPKDDTPGCTVEACSFKDGISGIRKKKADVVGISGDNFDSHRKFSQKYSLPFLLLSDTDHAAAKAYGVWQNRGIFGWGIARTTFLVAKGKIKKVFPQVNPMGHADEILKAL